MNEQVTYNVSAPITGNRLLLRAPYYVLTLAYFPYDDTSVMPMVAVTCVSITTLIDILVSVVLKYGKLSFEVLRSCSLCSCILPTFLLNPSFLYNFFCRCNMESSSPLILLYHATEDPFNDDNDQ